MIVVMSHKQLIHMVGIGGSGMSGLALLLKRMGFGVSGSDLKESAAVQALMKAGIPVSAGNHDRRHVPKNACLVVYSSAVVLDKNPEIGEAQRRGITLMRRGSVLAQVSRLKKAVTISGTHGKTTTSSMTGWIMERSQLKPTVIVGGEILNTRSSTLFGSGDYIVLETDESDGSFLEVTPWIAVVTNVDNDHVEHYGSMENLIAAFKRHLEQVPFYGWAVLCGDDQTLYERVMPWVKVPLKTYGLKGRPHCKAVDLQKREQGYSFAVLWEGRRAAQVGLRVPGLHNVQNALAAMTAAHLAGVSWKDAAEALGEYRGIRRRLEVLGCYGGVLFLDDYGHHPTEIAATMQAAREFYAKGRLMVCFQPHRYSRTKQVGRFYGPAFRQADRVWVCPIYAASEKPIPGVSEEMVLRSLRKEGISSSRFPGRPIDLKKELREGDAFLTIGAGDVWKIGEDLSRRM